MHKIPDGYYAAIFFEKKSKTYGVRFPDFPGIITFGNSIKKATRRAEEALSAALESDFDRNQSLPLFHKIKLKKGEKIIYVPIQPEVRTAYLLRQWREKAGLTQKQLADRLGITFQAYQRMERPGKSNLTVITLQRIAEALDKHLILDLRAA